MDKVLNQLRRRFIIVFMIVGGAFLLLAYGSIFVANVTQTIGAIDKDLNDVLDKTCARSQTFPFTIRTA